MNCNANITKHSIDNSLASMLQFSKSPLLDLSGISQIYFDKYNTTINFNRSGSSPSDDLLAGNRLMTTSDRVANIENATFNLNNDVCKDKNGLDLTQENQQIFKIHCAIIAKLRKIFMNYVNC